MAKQTVSGKSVKKDINRPGTHSKSKTSSLKQSKNYKKSYKGQGK